MAVWPLLVSSTTCSSVTSLEGTAVLSVPVLPVPPVQPVADVPPQAPFYFLAPLAFLSIPPHPPMKTSIFPARRFHTGLLLHHPALPANAVSSSLPSPSPLLLTEIRGNALGGGCAWITQPFMTSTAPTPKGPQESSLTEKRLQELLAKRAAVVSGGAPQDRKIQARRQTSCVHVASGRGLCAGGRRTDVLDAFAVRPLTTRALER